MDNLTELAEVTANTKIKQLATFIKGHELPDQKDSMSTFIGYWYPIYGESPEYGVPRVYETIEKLKGQVEMTTTDKPRFIDLGAGQGMVGAIASIAGFDSFNIELDPDKASAGKKYAEVLENMDVIPRGSVHNQAGSYYLPEFYQQGKRWMFDYYKITPASPPTAKGLLDAATELNLTDSDYETVNAKLDSMNKTSALTEARLIDDNGYLKGEVVYCYPSDILFNYAFMEQMKKIMRPGSLLVLSRQNSQITKILEEKQMEGFSQEPTINEMLVFKREMPVKTPVVVS